jgi:EthD domain
MLLLTASVPGLGATSLAAEINQAVGRDEPSTLTIEVAERLPLSLTKPAGDGTLVVMEPSHHSALMVVRGEIEAAARRLVDLLNALSTRIDRSASEVITGHELAVKSGTGHLWVVMPVRRLTSLSREAFQERWRTVHAEFGRRMAAPGYRQIHAQPLPAGTGLGALVSINDHDGAAVVSYGSEEEMERTRSSAEVARHALEDERRFIDHARSSLMVFRSCAPSSQ